MSRILLKKQTVCEELDITEQQFDRLVWQHKLPVVKLTGRTGEVRVRRSDLDAYIESCVVPARVGPLAGQ